MRSITLALALLLLPAAAAAQTAPLPITMDRLGEGNRLGAELGLVAVDEGDNFYAARLDLGGQLMGRSGFGGFADVAISQTLGAADGEYTALNDFELGGFYRMPINSG